MSVLSVKGSEFVQNFLHMRFAVRDVHMRSMALSRRLTALTGRMSVLRADDVVNPDFISVIENDYLEHWFWGRFRFLSGDDKSSWFYLLTRGADFLYVPDATVYTIERVEDGRPLERIKQNLMRWSGNMLRSGTRAIPLGPRRLGFYLWWCLIDQRIAIWTSLIGLCCGLLFALAGRWELAVIYLVWVGCTRLGQSVMLFFYYGKINMTFPFMMYLNQIAGASIKLFMFCRLPLQRWANRNNQKAGFGEYRVSVGILRLPDLVGNSFRGRRVFDFSPESCRYRPRSGAGERGVHAFRAHQEFLLIAVVVAIVGGPFSIGS